VILEQAGIVGGQATLAYAYHGDPFFLGCALL